MCVSVQIRLYFTKVYSNKGAKIMFKYETKTIFEGIEESTKTIVVRRRIYKEMHMQRKFLVITIS